MKQINIAQMNRSQKDEALNEAKILQALKSPYIVGYHDSFIENEKLCILMEYCENGDLAQLLKARHGRLLEEDMIWKYFIEISLALLYLHNKKILHRDMKTMNVFLTKDFHVRLGDLGVAKVLSQNTNFAHTMVGTPYYLSPELCQEKPYNEKSDVWSLGCVLYEMCALKHPFESRNQAALIMKIIQGKYDPLSPTYSRDLIEIVTQCLQKDYRKRPTVHDVLSMPSVQLKAKALRIDVPEKSTLGMRIAEAKKSPPISESKKVVPIAQPPKLAKPILSPKSAVDASPIPIKPQKEVKKIIEKLIPTPVIDKHKIKEDKKSKEPSPVNVVQAQSPIDKKLDKKPPLPSPVSNINNNEFRKLLKEKPPIEAPASDRKDKKQKPLPAAVITAPNFPQVKQNEAPNTPQPDKLPPKPHVIVPAPANLQQTRGKPSRVRKGAPAGLARKVHQVIQPTPVPIKRASSKNKLKKNVDIDAYNDDEEKKAVAELPDFVGDNKNQEKEEQYQIKKPSIPGLTLAKSHSCTDTKKSEIPDPDQLLKNALGEDFSLVKNESEPPKIEEIKPEAGIETIVKEILDPSANADILQTNEKKVENNNRPQEIGEPELLKVGFQISDEKVGESPISMEKDNENFEEIKNNVEPIENDAKTEPTENNQISEEIPINSQQNEKNENEENQGNVEENEEIKSDSLEKESEENQEEIKEIKESEGMNLLEIISKKEAEYNEKLSEFEKHKSQLTNRIPIQDIEKCCELVKVSRTMVFYAIFLIFYRLPKRKICYKN